MAYVSSKGDSKEGVNPDRGSVNELAPGDSSVSLTSRQPPERCRTCQKRKVKCGQEIPICFNCKRLGINCERKSRYKWKDITLSTRRSISSITSERRSVWDPKRESRNPSEHHYVQDSNYTALENAAISAKPGTYFVDTTPENFSDMYSGSDATDIASSIGTLPGIPAPGTIIMERFKDYGNPGASVTLSRGSRSIIQLAPSRTARTITGSEFSGITHNTGASIAKRLGSYSFGYSSDSAQLSMFNKALVRSRDLQYYNHYRSVVVYNMQVNSRFPSDVRPFCHAEGETEDPFETAAASFNPLYHAILALSALSMAHRERLDRVDSLQHYQRAVEGLRENSALESVNMIYTHYFLLLYEVAACEPGRTNFELDHLRQIARLLGWFFVTASANPSYAFRDQLCPRCTEVSMTCVPSNMLYCDMYNLMLRRQLHVVTPRAMVTGFFNAIEEGGTDWHLEAAYKGNVELAYKMVKLTVLGGWAQRVVRDMIEGFNNSEEGNRPELEAQHHLLDEKIKTMNAWCASNSSSMPRDIYDATYTEMPLQCQTYFDSAQFTIRTLLLYAHTSVFPQQHISLSLSQEAYIQSVAREILYLARPRWGSLRAIAASNLVALFMCGTVVNTPEEKHEVYRTLQIMGVDASGRNFVRAIEVLQELWREQERVKGEGGDERQVDWFVFLRGKGMLDFSLFGI